MREHERRYYELRAPEYDDWWHGVGRFVPSERPGWDEEEEQLGRIMAAFPAGRVLDAACGTGYLTRHLRGEVVALDQSQAMLSVARERLPEVTFVHGDALGLPFPDAAFDLVFTSHFYGHLREDDRKRFLREARRVAPQLVIVDSAVRPGEPPEDNAVRTLSDGSVHLVFKRRFEPDRLAAELGGGEVLFAGAWFVAIAA